MLYNTRRLCLQEYQRNTQDRLAQRVREKAFPSKRQRRSLPDHSTQSTRDSHEAEKIETTGSGIQTWESTCFVTVWKIGVIYRMWLTLNAGFSNFRCFRW